MRSGSPTILMTQGQIELHSRLIPAADRDQIIIPPLAAGGAEKVHISRY